MTAATTREGAVPDVRALYTARHRSYTRFVEAVLYPQGLRAFLRSSGLLRPGMRVLDAGCGTGILTRALLGAMRDAGVTPKSIDAFDLTPAMLERFRHDMPEDTPQVSQLPIRLAEADVLDASAPAPDWQGYDLIVSSAMLEYLPRERLSEALSNLGARLGPGGVMVVFISRRNFLMRMLIGLWWKSNLYTRAELSEAFSDAGLVATFRRFPLSGRHLDLWGFVIEARMERS